MSTSDSEGMRASIMRIPVLGYLIRLGWFIVRLPKQFDNVAAAAKTTETRNLKALSEIQQKLNQQAQELHEQTERDVKFDEQIADIKHRLLSAKTAAPAQGGAAQPADAGQLFADDHDLDDFYMKFENRFRGTEEEITERLQVYIPRLKKTGLDFTKHPVLDIGCGRGEFLRLLKSKKIRGIGIDINESMVQRCKDMDIEAVQGDALAYLMKQKTGSLGAITGFHIVEHIPFNFLLRLFEECHRVLAPGGLVIFETPNPENLHVGSFSFYHDPSHLNPVVPAVLAFAIENRGFEKTDILRLHPKGDGHENDKRKDKYVAEVLQRYYMAQDYAVIGTKTKA